MPMSSEVVTERLTLRAFSASELDSLLRNISVLQDELRLPLAPDIIDADVSRAIRLKLVKMKTVEPNLHDWFTYWLIIINSISVGAGMIGFKGFPDAVGSAEVGYGISIPYRNHGYMTEALIGLSSWAFKHGECRLLTAQTVVNPASERVLYKAGWQRINQVEASSDWIMRRETSLHGH